MQPELILSLKPGIRLYGKVDESMLSEFLRQRADVDQTKPALLELSTSGGDADIGRRIANELIHWQASSQQEVLFLGKSFVYSAGITIMSGIKAWNRFMTADCELLIHERKIKKIIHLDGALRGCRTLIHDALAEIDSGQRLERDGFTELVKGTSLSIDDVMAKVLERDWYLTAAEAQRLGLIASVV